MSTKQTSLAKKMSTRTVTLMQQNAGFTTPCSGACPTMLSTNVQCIPFRSINSSQSAVTKCSHTVFKATTLVATCSLAYSLLSFSSSPSLLPPPITMSAREATIPLSVCVASYTMHCVCRSLLTGVEVAISKLTLLATLSPKRPLQRH